MDKREVIYFQDELNDEFSTTQITPIKIDENYQYICQSLFKKFTHFFWYRIVATPLAFFYVKLVFHHKIVGRECLKQFKGNAYFMYGNHTQDIADAVIPTLLNIPKDVYLVAHPNNVSVPGIGKVARSLGALPLPDNMKASKNFVKAIEKRIEEKAVVAIYPEAHIWPFYTKIRPFKDESFRYPVKYGVPTFCFTNTYQKRRWSSKPKLVTYIDGPFYADEGLSLKDQKTNLRNKVYTNMCERAEKSTIERIKYIKKESKEDNG